MIKQFFSILIGLLLFVAPAFGCFVCKDRIPELSATQRIMLWECCHSFHLPCIYLWSISESSCPQCKKPIASSIIAQLYSLMSDNPVSSSIIEQINYLRSECEKQKPAPTVDPSAASASQSTPPSADPAPTSARQKPAGKTDILSSTSAARRRTLFVVCGCTGIAAMASYYFKDSISELLWGKKEAEPSDTEPQEIV